MYSRIAISAELSHHFGQAEIYRTLHAAKVSQAALPAQTLSIKTVFCMVSEAFMCATKKK
jgi:hypothetical protein